jgi:hypothetical protein
LKIFQFSGVLLAHKVVKDWIKESLGEWIDHGNHQKASFFVRAVLLLLGQKTHNGKSNHIHEVSKEIED